jgi:hypothetical protein
LPVDSHEEFSGIALTASFFTAQWLTSVLAVQHGTLYLCCLKETKNERFNFHPIFIPSLTARIRGSSANNSGLSVFVLTTERSVKHTDDGGNCFILSWAKETHAWVQ